MRKVIVAVVGVVVLSGTGFAQDVLQLRGPGSQIGVRIQDHSDGVSVLEVRPGTPAERAGFKGGDVVVQFDGETIRSVRQFTRVVEETRPGKAVSAVVLRDGSRQTLTVTPETVGPGDFIRQRPDLADFQRRLPEITADVQRRMRNRNFDAFTPRRSPFLASPRLGAEVTPLSAQLAQYFGVKAGVLVSTVESDSPAARAGLRPGDVITAIDGRSVEAPVDLTDRLRSVSQGSSLELRVTRDKKELTLKATR